MTTHFDRVIAETLAAGSRGGAAKRLRNLGFPETADWLQQPHRERSEAAREARRARGQNIGRPKALTADQARQVRALRDAGEGVPVLCATFGASRATIYRALAAEGVSA